jgi:hypothetical protein
LGTAIGLLEKQSQKCESILIHEKSLQISSTKHGAKFTTTFETEIAGRFPGMVPTSLDTIPTQFWIFAGLRSGKYQALKIK